MPGWVNTPVLTLTYRGRHRVRVQMLDASRCTDVPGGIPKGWFRVPGKVPAEPKHPKTAGTVLELRAKARIGPDVGICRLLVTRSVCSAHVEPTRWEKYKELTWEKLSETGPVEPGSGCGWGATCVSQGHSEQPNCLTTVH